MDRHTIAAHSTLPTSFRIKVDRATFSSASATHHITTSATHTLSRSTAPLHMDSTLHRATSVSLALFFEWFRLAHAAGGSCLVPRWECETDTITSLILPLSIHFSPPSYRFSGCYESIIRIRTRHACLLHLYIRSSGICFSF